MKILGSDYDGTLNFNGMDDKKRQAIARWRSAGNLFVLVSGRHSANVRDLHIQQNFPCDYFIGSNGAVIRNSNNEVVHADCCDPQHLLPLVRFLLELNCPFALVHGAEDWFYVYDRPEQAAKEPACSLETMPPVTYYTQVTTCMPTEEEAVAVAEKVRERFGAWFNPLQNGTSIDIVRSDANKAKGLYALTELVGATHGDVITVGDNINDSDMIREFKSYAMENGVQAIKDLADFVTPGVAELIHRELELAQGLVVHNYKIPSKGIRKKVICHFSDVHLSVQDPLSTPEEAQKARNAAEGWANRRLWFANKYKEPALEAQQQPAEEHFSRLLTLAQEGDAVVMAGDLCEYVSHANLRFLDEKLGSCSVPWMAVCGNHDMAEEIPEGYLLSRAKEPVQVQDLGDLLMVGIDNAKRRITAQQNSRLRELLSTGKPMILAMHIPVMTEDNRELLTDCGEYFQLNHAGADSETLEFNNILRENAPQIVAVLAGHLHFGNVSEIASGLPQYVSSQGILGNINRYEIGE